MVLIIHLNIESLEVSIIRSSMEEEKTEYILTDSWVCWYIFRHVALGNGPTDGTTTGGPANALWQSWPSMDLWQASGSIQYFTSEMIAQAVWVNMIVSKNGFPTTNVAFHFWTTLWSSPAVGLGTFWSLPAWWRGNICPTSDLGDMLVDHFWHLSTGSTMGLTICCTFGNWVRALVVLAWLGVFSSGTLVVPIVISRRAWSRCRSSCPLSKWSSLISDIKVDYPEC